MGSCAVSRKNNMISRKLTSGDFVGVSKNSVYEKILLQLTDSHSQVRVALTKNEAIDLINKLQDYIDDFAGQYSPIFSDRTKQE